MKKADRIVRYFCNYVIDNKVCLNDPEEDEEGSCVSQLKLSDILKGTNIDIAKVTVDDLTPLASFQGEVYRNNNEETDEYYGEVCYLVLNVCLGDVYIDLWDGY